jgi:CRISPR-associated protein Cmr6
MLELSRDRIVQIFGNEAGEPDPELQRCGAVCFHDAWPTKWPALIVDIVNSHHAKYYGGGDDDTPGDWESPVPVNFLAVATGTEYSFCLTARRADTDPGLVNDAAECLRCALSGSGAGAKTAAGYGWFLPAPVVATSRVPSRNARWNRSYRLRLESSAFLAGARQEQQDCDLRSATLRGQLRSWWRTLHSGFLKNQQLRQLEGALWGNTTQGAAIRIHLVRSRSQSEPRLHAHPAQGSGLRYLAYGMDEKSHGVRRQRWKLEAGAEWELHVSISASRYFSRPPKPDEDRRKLDQTPLTQEQVVSHFESALWLLTHYGGVGSKGRKGFGSLRVVSENPWRSPLTLDSVRATAASLRQDLNLPNAFTESLAESAALSHPGVVLKEIEVTVRSGDAAIEQAGNAYMKTAGSVGHKHNPDKQSLGLPRKIHGPGIKPLPHQNSVTHLPPLFLDTPRRDPLHQRREEDARYASPVHLHVTEVTTGRWLVRLLAFPAAFLPDHAQSAAYLKKFSDSFAATLEVAASSGGSGLGGHRESGPAHPEPRRAASGYKLVEVKVLEIKTLNDKPSLRVQESGRKPGMLNTGVPPASLPAEGDTITVYWSTTSNPASPTYRWDLPEPPTQGKSGTSKKKS